MTTTSPESLNLLERAAELRAAGIPWAETATRLAVDAQELRKLASEHVRDYERLMRRARNEVLRESLDAAVAALRTHLASPEPRVSMSAATTLIRYELARLRYGPQEAGAKLERHSRRLSRREAMTETAREARNRNVQETAKVPNRQDVNAAKNVTQSDVLKTQPASATPPAAPPAQAATGVTEKNKASVADEIRRRRLVDVFARGQTAPLVARDDRLSQEVERLIRG
jgi:hypothetical protein